MRTKPTAVALLALSLALAAAPALAADAPLPTPLPPPAGSAAADLPPPPPPPLEAAWPRYGLRLDVGVPDGAVAAFVYRPLPALRLSAGPAWNYLGWGVQVGVAFTPIRWAVSPTLSADYGHYFDADASFLASSAGVPEEVRPLLEKVGYDYLDAQLGLELGSPRGFSFFLRGGIAYLWTTVRGANQSISNAGASVVTVADPRIRATIPTVKLGFLYFF
jgi:hypothetical protein